MEPSAAALIEQASEVRQRSATLYPNFLVGPTLGTANGRILTGCNVENSSYGLTICAEAERIVGWDYGDAPNFAQQLKDFQLLAAPREGKYEPPAALRKRIHIVHLSSEWSTISSSAFREAFCQNQNWERFVPPTVARVIRQNGTDN